MGRLLVAKALVVISILVIGIGLYIFLYKNIVPDNGILISEHGNLMWYNSPVSDTYKDKVYVGYMTSKRSVFIAQFDKGSMQLIAKKELHKYRYLDDHGGPVLYVIRNGIHQGKILSIYNLHNSRIFSRRSTYPDRIDEWDEERVVSECECTYPNLLEIKGTLYLFYRKQISSTPVTRGYFLRVSLNYGDSWSDEREIIVANSGEWIYAFPQEGRAGEISIIWGVYREEFSDVKDIFYARSTNLGVTWSSNLGYEELDKLTSLDTFLIYKSPKNTATRVWDVIADSENQLAIAMVNYDEKLAIAYWSRREANGQWKFLSLGEITQSYYPCGLTLRKNDPHTLYISKKLKNDLMSTIYKVVISEKENSWRVVDRLINNSSYDYCRPQAVDGDSKLRVLFTAVRKYEGFMDFDTALLGYTK